MLVTAIATEAASDKLTASTQAKLKAGADAIKAIEANSVVTVDATEAKFKATGTFDDSIPEANQVNFDVAAAEVNIKTEAKFITAGPEAELMDSTTVQQPTSDTDSAASKASVVATAIAEALWQATGTNFIVTRSLCNAHPVRAAVATVGVKFETDGASGADVEVALEAVAADGKLAVL